MIQIAVVTRQGMPTGQRLAAQFGPEGGTIGRADTNTLVLSDPDRTVSRVHGQVLMRDGRFFIVDRGSNPMQCNGQALGAGNEAPLNDGDRLIIGSFELSVQAGAMAGASGSAAAAPASAPSAAAAGSAFASHGAAGDDPFGDLLAGLAPPPAPAAAQRAPAASIPAPTGAADPLLFPNPMESVRAGPDAARAADPFADLLGDAPAAPAVAGAGAFDDFSDLGLSAASGSKGVGIDSLFGGPGSSQGLGGDPLALSPLADPLLQPNTASHLDPLAALQGGARPSAAPRSDHLPIGQFGFVPPVASEASRDGAMPDSGHRSAAAAPLSTPGQAQPPSPWSDAGSDARPPAPGLARAPAPAPAPASPAAPAPVLEFDDQTGLPIILSGSAPVRSGPPVPAGPALASPSLPVPMHQGPDTSAALFDSTPLPVAPGSVDVDLFADLMPAPSGEDPFAGLTGFGSPSPSMASTTATGPVAAHLAAAAAAASVPAAMPAAAAASLPEAASFSAPPAPTASTRSPFMTASNTAMPNADAPANPASALSGHEDGSRPSMGAAASPAAVPVGSVGAAAAAPVAAVASRPSSTGTASDADLLAALLRGLGPLHQPPEALTPGLMERIGQLLRSSTEGTLQLLLTRQEFKREVRAEVTMIAAQANNPLKFSPTVEVGLAHLLGPGVRGFMSPEAAMRDAYDDLRSHQFGVMVGMRAALAHVISRFSPQELETKITARSALDSLFTANRKAKLWDQFVALYGGIASEAEDDFHHLFGKAFIEAYEAQMARLKSGS